MSEFINVGERKGIKEKKELYKDEVDWSEEMSLFAERKVAEV